MPKCMTPKATKYQALEATGTLEPPKICLGSRMSIREMCPLLLKNRLHN